MDSQGKFKPIPTKLEWAIHRWVQEVM